MMPLALVRLVLVAAMTAWLATPGHAFPTTFTAAAHFRAGEAVGSVAAAGVPGAYLGFGAGAGGLMHNITELPDANWASPLALPSVPFLGGLDFDLYSLVSSRFKAGVGSSYLSLSGSGFLDHVWTTFTFTGHSDGTDTVGMFTFDTTSRWYNSGTTSGTFSFSGSTAAVGLGEAVPIPEPPSLLLLAVAVLGLVLLGRRRWFA